jgi:hypothetical protein
MAYIKSMFNRLMHFSWEKHQILSRDVAKAADKDMGFAIALMGVGLTLLSKDLLLVEQQQSLSESNKNTFC